MSRYYSSILNVLSPSFNNTYSLAFDGVDDTVNFQNDWFAPSTPSQTTGNTVGSVSFWVKLPTNITSGGLMGMVSINVGANSKPLIWIMFNRTASSTGRYIRAYVSGANSTQTGVLQTQQFFVYDDSSTTYPNSGITFSADTWYHIAVVHDKDATNRYKAYINGNEFLIPNTTGTGSNGERTIGEMPYSLPYNPTSGGITPNVDLGFSRTSSSGGTQYFEGNLDEVAFWNSALTSENVTSIYNSGVTNDLTSLNPIVWLRNGDNGTFKSPQWLIPNNINVANSRFSNYSFEYDGIDDYVDLGTGSALDIFGSDFTISLWAKWGSQTTNSNGFVNFASFTNKAMVGLGFGTQYGKITFGTGNTSTIGCLYDCGSGYDDDNWHNIICIENSGVRSVYVDGVNITSTGSSSSISVGTNNDIGNRARSRYFVGSIDEVAVFNSIVDVASIYNSGVPNDLASLSPVGYWRSENSTFSTNWTVTDNGSGSNDGTSANMTIEDRVGDAPNSTSNALSYNMDEADRVEDVPS